MFALRSPKLNFFVSLAVVVSAQTFAADSYRVNNGVTTTITEWSLGRTVVNSCGVDEFVPTRSSSEWVSFINNHPGCVAVSATPAPTQTCNWAANENSYWKTRNVASLWTTLLVPRAFACSQDAVCDGPGSCDPSTNGQTYNCSETQCGHSGLIHLTCSCS